KFSRQYALQEPLICEPCCPFRGRRTAITLAADFEFRRVRLPQALDRKSQHFVLNLQVDHATHNISLRYHRCSRQLLRSPEMEYFACSRSKATGPFSSTTAS